jgi:hypothetical protein
MKLELKDEPRCFNGGGVNLRDYGRIILENNDMISLVSENGKVCEITAKDWGFYLAPSINARLKKEGFKVALVKNREGKLFLNAVEADKMESFQTYLVTNQDSTVLCWLDEWDG